MLTSLRQPCIITFSSFFVVRQILLWKQVLKSVSWVAARRAHQICVLKTRLLYHLTLIKKCLCERKSFQVLTISDRLHRESICTIC